MTASGPTRAIAYVRVSTDVQAERGMGLAVQRERVTAFAAENGWQLVDVVAEAASGGVREGELFSWEHRPALLDLVERAKRDDYNVLVVAKLDRLSRDYATLVVIERMLDQHGVSVVSTDEDNGDGPVAEYLRGNLALIAQLERAMIRQRLNAGKAVKRRLGRHIHGRIPFGYTSSRGELEPDPTLAPVVKRIFTAARDGNTPGRIARDLETDGAQSPTGAGWNRTTVRNIIENLAYTGERYDVKKAHPPIVTRRLWNAANTTLRARRRPAATE